VEVRVLAPTGVIGAGFKKESLERGISLKPHVIACDAGSTDSGPYSLGSETPKFSRDACKRDMQLLLAARQRLNVPLIIGSCGTNGRDVGVDWMAELVKEIAKEQKLLFKLALIYSNQSSFFIAEQYREGKINPLEVAPELSEVNILNSNIVGMMGTEPLSAALDKGADVILAGRASDSALYAVVPERMGASKGLVWHAAKTIECGAACCTTPSADGLIAYIRDDHFDIEPLDLELAVSPLSIAAHTLYENANPYLLTEPSGVVDTKAATYKAINDRVVRVTGSKFHETEKYSIKLEGSECIGYETVIIGGIRDPKIFNMLPKLLPKAQDYFKARIADIFAGKLSEDSYSIGYRFYGLGAVMGTLETEKLNEPSEVGVLITVKAPTQEISKKIAALVAHVSSHLPIPGYEGLISSIAYPFSPPEIERGASYRFSLNHVIYPEHPTALFRTELMEIK
jgi:hypothetical protein